MPTNLQTLVINNKEVFVSGGSVKDIPEKPNTPKDAQPTQKHEKILADNTEVDFSCSSIHNVSKHSINDEGKIL